MEISESSMVLTLCAGTGALLSVAVLIQWMSTGRLGGAGAWLATCGVALLLLSIGSTQGWFEAERRNEEAVAPQAAVDQLRLELKALALEQAAQADQIRGRQGLFDCA